LKRGGDYLFVSGPEGDARRYRCDHQAEQLRFAGASVDVGYYAELQLERLVDRYRTFVLYRVPWDTKAEAFLARARERDKRVIADVDDLVFDVEHVHEIRALAKLPAADRQRYVSTIERLGRTLREVDGVVVSTEPLRGAALKFNDQVAIAPNAVSAAMASAAGKERRRAANGEATTIAYLSGTPTHDDDFLQAADGLLRALDHFPAAHLLVVGHLTLDERFQRHRDRVRQVPTMSWRRLPKVLASVDVNLAPLERDNVFTDCKSCLKYLEAALLGVPTIASPRADFRRVIPDGTNGLLAEDDADWSGALRELVESPVRRAAVGDAALRDVLANHTTKARSVATAQAFANASGEFHDEPL
jgi:glycosyltransferase involved in cell wall biosynthesis